MTGADRQRIAIVGIAARFPGASGPEEYWRLLRGGVDGIRDRDPHRPGPDRGGFVDGVDEFEPGFFRMSPREAAGTDPQQRLALELAWQGLEDAAIAIESAPAPVAVFLGVMAGDYADLLVRSGEVTRHSLTGTSRAMIANRVSYALDLDGPSMTIDTGQSSSLVAVHLACDSLRRGETDLALAGGVHLNVSPMSTAIVQAAGALSPDGRCFVFDERANGYVRGEGGGIVVLKPLSHAVANGDRIYAVIEGSAVRTGSGDTGLTVPSAAVQARTIGEALGRAGRKPDQVQYVELHGTGTPVGDPIEAQALGTAYGRARRSPLVVGSVKTNIGHLEGAAGIAGLIKAALCIHRRELVPNVDFSKPNPQIPLDDLGLRVAASGEPWPSSGEPVAGVTSLGIGGSCCHMLVTAAPVTESAKRSPASVDLPSSPVPIPVSGPDPDAVRAQAARLRDHLMAHSELDLRDVGFSTATTRTQFAHRAVIVAAERQALLAGLSAVVDGDSAAAGVVTGRVLTGLTAVLFTGQGAQRARMGVELARAYPAFDQALDQACSELDQWLGRSLRTLLEAAPDSADAALLDETQFTQPALFAFEVALYRLAESFGVRPDYLIGHSVGELAAAHVAGVLSLPDACRLVAARGRLMGALPPGGGMAAVEAEEDEVRATLPEGLSIAAVNGPRAVVVSGDQSAIDAWLPDWAHRKTTTLRVSHAFHSHRMDPMLDDFRQVAERLQFHPPQIPVVSNLTGATVCVELTDPDYWVRQVREAVRFHDGVRALREHGVTRFFELGPDAVLTAAARQILGDDPEVMLAAATRARRPEPDTFAAFLGTAHAAGAGIDWAAVFPHARRVDLPTYAFRRQHFPLPVADRTGDVTAAGVGRLDHPMLAAAVPVGDRDEWVLTGRLSAETHPWLFDHRTGAATVAPPSALVELAAAAGRHLDWPVVDELSLSAPLVLPDHAAVRLQVCVGEPGADGRRPVVISSRGETSGPDAEVARHAEGFLAQPSGQPQPWRPAEWPPPAATPIDIELLHARLAEAGYDDGPTYQCLHNAWRNGDLLYLEIRLSDEHAEAADSFGIHPALLEAVLHGRFGGERDGAATAGTAHVWSGVRLERAGADRVRARIRWADATSLQVDLADERGEPVASVDTVTFRPADQAVRPTDPLYQVEWVPVPAASTAAEPAVPLDPVAGLGALEDAIAGGATANVVVAEVASAALALELMQRWLASEVLSNSRLMLVTRNGIAAGAEAPDLAVAPVWGLVRSAQSEHPGRFLLVDVDDQEVSPSLLGVLATLDEPQLAVRQGKLLAPRVVRSAAAEPAPAVDPDGTVLITGGTGGLGVAFARHLARAHKCRHLLLVSRRGPDAGGVPELVAELAELGCRADVVACDVADRGLLADLLTGLDRPLTAVVHAAGVLDDAVILSLSGERLERVMRSKGDAARHLHELTMDHPLTAFVLFSSVAALIGSPGQGNYAAANAYLDALAAQRRAQGLPATSLAWGLLADPTGMAGSLDAAATARWARMGIQPLATTSALDLFERARSSDRAVLVPARFDAAALRELAREGALPPMLRGLARMPGRQPTRPVAGALAQRLSEVRPAERDRLVLEIVQRHVAAILGHGSSDAIDPHRAFKDLGFDSLAGVELRNRLIQATGVELPSTLVFNHPTAAGVAKLLQERVDGGGTADPAPTASRHVTADEPLAIVGISCRYPGGADTPDAFWSLVAEGRDAVTGLPEDRGWDLQRLYDPDPERAGTLYTRGGGFLHDAGDFDAGFFGISPREALATDPQQRLMLEASWQALEDAGIDPTRLRGSDTGVFCGVMSSDDYGSANPPELEGFRLTGTTNSVVSGRVAYAFGLEGPAVSVDTACSSSLVALHLAAQALRSGDCSLALAAGVTVMAKPFLLVEFSRQRGLSVDGRCKAYAAAADGTGFADGLGVLVLERLSDARRNGRRIWGLVRGSAVNQDGASNGLTAPNGRSQERVIRQALASARLTASDVDAVEGHGTGTRLGDPIEAQALLATYGRDRRDGEPLWLGSVKSNIGHTQAAAGVAGVIKMLQAMRHEVLPRTLHVDAPSPHVDWESGQVRLLTQAQPWPASDRPRRAGISSFGVSGTNAHVIVEEPPPAAPGGKPNGRLAGPVPVLLSGRGDAALRAQADRLRALLIAQPELTPLDVAYSTATARAHLESRAVVVGADRSEILAGLRALSAGEPAPDVAQGQAGGGATVFVFPGQGAQWERMAVELLDSAPVFAAEIAACEKALSQYVDWSLEDVLRGTHGAPSLQRVDVVQPALFAVMAALAALWRSYGVRPATVVGHSQGEVAAAYVAGGLSLDDAARIVAVRSQLVRDRLAGSGGMVSLALPEPAARKLIAPYGAGVSIATINGPAAVVIAGEPAVLDEIIAVCERDDIRARKVPVDYASHSPQVEVLREELCKLLAPITPCAGEVPIYSTVLGRIVDTAELDADYWYRNLREPVGFEAAVRALLADGMAAFVEMSPHPVLTMAIQETVQAVDAGDRVAVLGSLRRDEGGPRRFTLSLAEAYVAGVFVDWPMLFADTGAVRVDLPTYAFQRQRYWLAPDAAAGDVAAVGLGRLEHPLLAAAVQLGDSDEWMFTGRVSVQAQPWLADHAVLGTVVVPGAALVELAAATGDQLGGAVVDELVLQVPLVLAEDETRQVQVRIGETDDDGRREVAVYSRHQDAAVPSASAVLCHARGWLSGAPAPVVPFPPVWPPTDVEPVPIEGLYAGLAEAGYEYGPAFQGVRAAWRNGADVYTELALPDDLSDAGFGVHPALLDAALHGALLDKDAGSVTDLPFSWSGVLLGSGCRGRARARISSVDDSAVRIDVVDDGGELVASVAKLVLRPVDEAELRRAPGDVSDSLFSVDWTAPANTPVDTAGIVVGAGTTAAGGTYPDLDALDRALANGDQVPDVVVVPFDSGAAVHEATAQALALVQRWLASERLANTALMVVTRGAVAAGGVVTDLAQSPVWGLLRSAQSEHPGRFLLVDVDEDAALPDWDALAALGEPQVAVRAGQTLVPRLRRVAPVPSGDAWRLSADGKGSLDLTIVASDAGRPLGVREVRVGVRAAGLNFRDVLIALGQYPGDAPLGSEAAGVVLEVGSEVSDLSPGDRVMGLVTDSFGPVAVADRRMLVPMPDRFSFVQAAAIPVVYLTALYGLVDLAGVGPGERVLIHAAAGGVGMAAVQLAQHRGAQVYATASPAKWDAVRALGVDGARIAASRDLAFRDSFLRATDGAGMDVVLDALAGELVDASLDLLPRGGRFVEMGKADIRDAATVAGTHPGVRYTAFDLFEVGHDRIQEMLAEIVGLFERGVLRHAPVRAWDVREGREAFRFLREGRNIGKIVLTVPAPLDPEGTVLITGGTGGLGALFATHLAAGYGVKRLLLASRRGPAAPGAGELVAELASLGAEARAVACDTASRPQLAALLDSLDHPLTAVIHAAGVLDDGVIESLSPERLVRVMRPKVDAALHLHELTVDKDLSAFVLFSSVAALMGTAGQGNYAAANAYLDALAAHRRAHGYPATSLAWGLWADATGMTSELGEADLARLERAGIATLPTELGMQLFDQTIGRHEALLGLVRLDFAALRAQARSGTPQPPLLRGLVRAPVTHRAAGNATGSLQERLTAVPPADREQVVLDLVRAQVAAVLGHSSPEAVDADRAFKALGFDSLAAVELRNRLSRATQLRLPTTVIFDHPTPVAVTNFLLATAGGAQESPRSVMEVALEKLDQLLTEVADDAQRFAEAEPSLRAFSNRLRHMLGGAEQHDVAGAVPDSALGDVSDEEMFDLIDKEIGAA